MTSGEGGHLAAPDRSISRKDALLLGGAHLVHLGAADRALAHRRGLAVLHRDFLRVRHRPLRAALEAVGFHFVLLWLTAGARDPAGSPADCIPRMPMSSWMRRRAVVRIIVRGRGLSSESGAIEAESGPNLRNWTKNRRDRDASRAAGTL